MFVVDTNVFIYAAETSFPEHQRCREQLERWRSQPGAWYSTWGVFYEFLRVVTHPRVFRKPWDAADAWSFLRAVLAAPGFDLLVETDRHPSVVSDVLAAGPPPAGNMLHDAHTATLMKEHGVRRIVTRNSDFHRFPFLEVIDPLL